MTKTLVNTYAQRSSAVRAAKRAGLANPLYEATEDGRVALFSVVKSTRARSTTGPVAKFRALFAENYGKVKWSEMIAMAVAEGVAENTAKTYYYKLRAELNAEQEQDTSPAETEE